MTKPTPNAEGNHRLSRAQILANLKLENHRLLSNTSAVSNPVDPRSTRKSATRVDTLSKLRTENQAFISKPSISHSTSPHSQVLPQHIATASLHSLAEPRVSPVPVAAKEEIFLNTDKDGRLPLAGTFGALSLERALAQTQPSVTNDEDSFPQYVSPLSKIFGSLSLGRVLSKPQASIGQPELQSLLKAPSKPVEPIFFNSDKYFTHNLNAYHPSTLKSMLGALVQNLFHHASQKAAGTSLLMSNAAVRAHHHTLVSNKDNIVSESAPQSAPRDIRTIIKAFNLDPTLTVYACCPLQTCSMTYPPTIDPQSGAMTYPLKCTNTKFGQTCNAILTKGSHIVNGTCIPRPVRLFPYNSFHDHNARMLSRPGIEAAIESYMRSQAFKDEIDDITSSPALRELQDSSGQPFVRENGSELRLVWGLAADWYNPYHNKTAGKSVSNGVIAGVCLSLPPELRTREENIWPGGAIPGAKKPAVDACNHFFRPAVDDLCDAYERGVFYSRTHDYPSGRTCLSAVVPVIADTMASKKMTGNCSHASKYFCSRCRLQRHQVDNLDPSKWPAPLSREQHLSRANTWATSASKSKQQRYLQLEGIRWSELLRLSYWKPAQYTITEAMHVLLLGLVSRHCRELLGLNLKDLPATGNEDADDVTEEEIDKAQLILESGTFKSLKSLKLDVLRGLCKRKEITLSPPQKSKRTKLEYIAALLGKTVADMETRAPEDDLGLPGLFESSLSGNIIPNQPLPSQKATSPQSHPKKQKYHSSPQVLTKADLEEMREQLNSTSRPNWQASLPVNFGSPEHGKLKADQWRTVMEFDLPVFLIRLMARNKGNTRLCQIVHLTLDLVMALVWGFSRRTSKLHANKYEFYMRRYLSKVQELFPDYALKPNHHYALHIPDILLSFGPLHGTWAYFLERLIGRLQKFNTNSKLGDIDVTLLKTYCRRVNLIQLLESPTCPEALKEEWKSLKKRINVKDLDLDEPQQATTDEPLRGARDAPLDDDIGQSLKTFILSDVLAADSKHLNCMRATVIPHHLHNGVLFTDSRSNSKHSLVYFEASKNGQRTDALVAGQIREIFEHHRLENGKIVTETFLAVHRYELLPILADEDPFGPFPDFRAAIYLRHPVRHVEIIRAAQLHCHANQCKWDEATVVMRAIDRCY